MILQNFLLLTLVVVVLLSIPNVLDMVKYVLRGVGLFVDLIIVLSCILFMAVFDPKGSKEFWNPPRED